MKAALDLLRGDPQADRVVPPTGLTARLTVLVAAVMALLAVLALALALASARAAERWGTELAQAASLRLPVAATPEQAAQIEAAALRVLSTTPGVAQARALDRAERAALLEPWIGAETALDALPLPGLIELRADPAAPYDAEGLAARLGAEVPGAVLDDHAATRAPLLASARRARLMGWGIVGLSGAALAAMIALAAQAVLSANGQVIAVLRQVGARDAYIARAFVRRLTLRAFAGALMGTGLGLLALALWPQAAAGDALLPPLRPQGAQWLWCLLIPALSAIVAFTATRRAALRTLEETP